MKLGQSTKRLVKLVEDQNLVQWTNPKKEVLNLITDRASNVRFIKRHIFVGIGYVGR